MSIADFGELFIDSAQDCYIYDFNTEAEIFRGSMDEIPEDMEYLEICSLDNIYRNNDGYIGINIDTTQA